MNTVSSIQYLLLKIRINRLREVVLGISSEQDGEQKASYITKSLLKISRFCRRYSFEALADKADECQTELSQKGFSEESKTYLLELFDKTQEISEIVNKTSGNKHEFSDLRERLSSNKGFSDYYNISYNKIPNILILKSSDDDTNIKKELSQKGRYKINTVSSLADAIRVFEDHKPDIVIIQKCLDDMQGTDILQILRHTPSGYTIPILFLSDDSSLDTKLQMFNAGADDYIVMPVNIQELMARVNAFSLRISTLRELALKDELTGLYNRQYMHEKLEEEISRWKRYNRPFSVMLIDVDDLKYINDTYGHIAGDYFIKEFSRILKLSLSHTDVLTRFGGDEFVVLLPETNVSETKGILEEIYSALASEKITLPDGESKIPISFCAGVSGCPEDANTDKGLLEKADAVLYKAKNSSKNSFITTTMDKPANDK